MFCTSCGSQAEAGTLCANCGAAVQAAAPPPPPPAAQYQQQPPYGQPAYGQPVYGAPNPDDQPSTLFNLIACCWPMPIGLILYLVMKDKTPNKAKAIGKWAIIGFVVSFVIGIISFIVSMIIGLGSFAAFGGLGDLFDGIDFDDLNKIPAILGFR